MVAFLPAGDAALVVEFGDAIDPVVNRKVMNLDTAIRAASLPGVRETVPTFRSLLVHYDPLATSGESLRAAVEGLLHEENLEGSRARRWTIPVCYESGHAPDLEEVAERTGLAPEEVTARHAAGTYHVYMIGFVPGYPYMGGLDDSLVLPRRENPRTRVPAGAVGIATVLTAVYPVESPGGWHLIGATPIRLFDVAWDPPALLAPGDEVVFRAVTAREFEEIREAVAAGDYAPPCEEVLA